MVRFIIKKTDDGYICNGIVYIPIWLDLLSEDLKAAGMNRLSLHSNMVRFIIQKELNNQLMQRGLHSNMVRFIMKTE